MNQNKPSDELRECLLAMIFEQKLYLIHYHEQEIEELEKLDKAFNIVLFDEPTERGLLQLLIDCGLLRNNLTLNMNLPRPGEINSNLGIRGRFEDFDKLLRREINLRLLEKS